MANTMVAKLKAFTLLNVIFMYALPKATLLNYSTQFINYL